MVKGWSNDMRVKRSPSVSLDVWQALLKCMSICVRAFFSTGVYTCVLLFAAKQKVNAGCLKCNSEENERVRGKSARWQGLRTTNRIRVPLAARSTTQLSVPTISAIGLKMLDNLGWR